MKEIFYERRAYESVDDRSLSWARYILKIIEKYFHKFTDTQEPNEEKL